MTFRERQGTGSVSAVLSVPTVVETKTERAGAFSWEDWFRHANAQQRAAALGLAHQQGLLYPHQLPPVTNGVKPTTAPAKETEVSSLLGRLLAAQDEPLAPPVLGPLCFFDTELDDLQKQAVLRALGTPDVFMLQGLPGAGKSRVLAEIILQAAIQGRRVLFLAAHTASLDVVLERLIGRSEVFALRFLDAPEKLEGLPAWLRGFTLEEQKQAFLERILTGARGNRDEVESVCRQRRDEEPLWAELTACLDQWRALDDRLRQLQERQPQLAASVEQDAETAVGAFTAQLADLRKICDDATNALDASSQTHQEAARPRRSGSDGIGRADRHVGARLSREEAHPFLDGRVLGEPIQRADHSGNGNAARPASAGPNTPTRVGSGNRHARSAAPDTPGTMENGTSRRRQPRD